MQETIRFGAWRLHPVRFALAATLLVAGVLAMVAAVRAPYSFRWTNLLESSFLLGGVLFFVGAWVAPQAAEGASAD